MNIEHWRSDLHWLWNEARELAGSKPNWGIPDYEGEDLIIRWSMDDGEMKRVHSPEGVELVKYAQILLDKIYKAEKWIEVKHPEGYITIVKETDH